MELAELNWGWSDNYAMWRTLNIWACAAFCAIVAISLGAQTIGVDAPGVELQAEGDQFVEATKALNAATDKDTRRKAIDLVLARAEELKCDPVPLVAVLKNRQPEALYTELLSYLRDNDKARHIAFLPALISAANDGGDKAATPRALALSYNPEPVIAALQAMLKGEDVQAAIAAAAFTREKVGKIKGRARMVAPLIAALEASNSDLRATAGRSLRELTLLDLPDDAAPWKEWLGQKSEETLIEEIANRQSEALAKSETDRAELEDKLVKVTLAQMAGQKENAAALITYLREAEFHRVRVAAAKHLGALLPKLEDDAKAQPAVDALGAILIDGKRSEELRLECAKALAGRPSLGFAYVDKALALNGLGTTLKIACVQGLKDGRAAPRLADLLRHEIDGINGGGGTLMPDLLAQAQSVFDATTTPDARVAVLAQVSRLLKLVESKFGSELPIGERDRFAALTQQACGALVGIARLRATDISDCVEPLLDVASAVGAAAPVAAVSALTALREALGVVSSRAGLIERMASGSLSAKLRAVCDRFSKDAATPTVFVAVLGVYAEIGAAPQDLLEALQAELLANAEAAQDPLAADAATSTRRGAIRRVLARTAKDAPAQEAIIRALLARPFGDNDVIDFVRNLLPPRAAMLVAALRSEGVKDPIRVGLLVKGMAEVLAAEVKDNTDYNSFADELFKSVRAELVRRITATFAAPPDDDAKRNFSDLAKGRLWVLFCPALYECLTANAGPSEARSFFATLLIERLKTTHPGRYDAASLKGEAAEFKKALEDLKPKLLEDGYSVG